MQALDRRSGKSGSEILCCYVNASSKMHIARITNIPNSYLEHVVFPGERFLFEALPEAELEVYQSVESDRIICERFLCRRLRVVEKQEG